MKKRTFYFTVLLWSLLLLFAFSSPVSAESEQTYMVGTDNLNVRVSPDRNANVIGKLKVGQSLVGFQEEHGWIQTYYDGEIAWVASQFLIKGKSNVVKKNSLVTDKKVTINSNGVRLRTGPGTNHSIITHASKGDVHKLIESNGDWNKVSLTDGSVAWVYTSLTSDGVVANEPLPVVKEESMNNVAGALTGYNIILDAGHGGIDPGAFSINGQQEKDLTLQTTKVVAQKLREAGATVLLTRSEDEYLSTNERVLISESNLTDVFISLHYNSHQSESPNGVSTHYYSNGRDQSLAESIQTELSTYTNMNDRGIRQDPFYVLRKNRDLSVLVELGFISNYNDINNINNSNHSSNVAKAITKGLVNYFK